MLIIDKLAKLRVQRFLTIVTWTCWGGRSVVLTGVETKLKLKEKNTKNWKLKLFICVRDPEKLSNSLLCGHLTT